VRGATVSRIRRDIRHEDRPYVVLIVEDETVLRGIVAEHLCQAGFTVIEATNAAEAVGIFGTGRTIDLVFSDVDMPAPIRWTELV
jgi:CheY-like chemotaxis protein